MMIEFNVPYAVGWKGKTYAPGICRIPEDLARVLGWQPQEDDEKPTPKRRTTKDQEV